MRIILGVFRYDKSRYLYFLGFEMTCIGHAVVTDKGIRAYEYLPFVRWVSECFRISNHTCVEDHFAGNVFRSTETLSFERSSVFKYEFHMREYPSSQKLRRIVSV